MTGRQRALMKMCSLFLLNVAYCLLMCWRYERQISGKRKDSYSMELNSKENIQQNSPRTFTANLFIAQLQKRVYKRIFIQIGLGIILFLVGFLFVTDFTNEINAEQNLSMLKETYLELYNNNCDFLNSEQTLQDAVNALSEGNVNNFERRFNRFNLKNPVNNEVILADADYNAVYSSFSQEELSDYLLGYNGAVCNNARNTDTDNVYTAVYFSTGSYSDYLFVKPLLSGDEIVGYISLFLIGTDWDYYLSDENFEGVIIDERDNVIYRSKAGFANQSGKFYPQKKRIAVYNNERYWTKTEHLDGYDATIYSMVYYPENHIAVVGLGVILILGISWFFIARWMSRTMAEYNAGQLSTLVKEIRMIQDGAHDHRIHMNTNDEFDEVAHRINRMLDSVRALNNRNMELVMLNTALETGQLEAQMNPHFLYNTLEIIRNLVIMDPDIAGELIEKLVYILRYSVNSSYREVRLREDMDYINAYLYIQKLRFGDRFQCEIDLPESCLECVVPKLLFQPLIENSIKYGYQDQMKLRVDITSELKSGILLISVCDNGPGVSEEKLKELSESLNIVDYHEKSLGLHNISRRLRLLYGEKSGVTVKNRLEGGFEVILAIDQNFIDNSGTGGTTDV